jgi:uncharacterized SAM-binding protein YcdF (DUF218 family)
MFFILSKTAAIILKPFVWVTVCLILGTFLRNITWKKRFQITGLSLLLFFSNGFLADQAMRNWEIPVTPIERLEGVYDYGIVLSGITDSEREPRDRVYFHKGADRVTHAFQLYKEGKIRKIVISGGNGRLYDQGAMDADNIVMFYRMTGVPEEDLLLENRSRNTYENARFSAEMIRKENGNARCLVITSAFHQRRAMACFRKQELDADGFSADFNSSARVRFEPLAWIIPSAGAFEKWETIAKEIFGIITYRIAGYI